MGRCGGRLPRLLLSLALLQQLAASDDTSGRFLLHWPDGVDPDALIELPILSPIPLTGGWAAGPTMRIAAEMAMDIVNSQQLILPGYKITTTWYDDECDADVALKVLLRGYLGSDRRRTSRADPGSSATSQSAPRWLGLGGNGCSGVCGRVATVMPDLRMPYVSYGCGAGFLSDTERYPHFQRFMTVENDMAKVFYSMGRQFAWTRVYILSGDPLRFEKLAEYVLEFFSATEIAAEWLTPRNPTWIQAQELMVRVKRSSQRAIIVLGYEPFLRKIMCASFLAGMPRGAVWMSGSHSLGWWHEDEPEIMSLEPRCNGELITSYIEGGVESSALGTPAEADMDTDLECMPGYTPRSFRTMLVQAFSDGYPLGDNILTRSPFTDIQANAADGICLWAYLFRHMLTARQVPLEDLSRPTDSTYMDMVNYIRQNISFEGVSGHVQFTGNDIKGVLNVRQVQDGQSTRVATVSIDGELHMLVTMRWGDGSTAPGSEFEACPGGSVRNALGDCEACELGYQYDGNFGECRRCSPGSYGMRTASGGVGCAKCAEGTFADVPGMTLCRDCGLGNYSRITGATACDECHPGHYAPREGAAECTMCPHGTWNNETGVSECNPCPFRQTTAGAGARSAAQCTCGAGDVFEGQELGCSACKQGMVCDQGGLGEPLQDAGYYIQADGDFRYTVFKCRSELRCPSGLRVGECPFGRTGVACDICLEQMHPAEGGKCAACETTAVPLQVSLTLLAGLAALCLFLAYTMYEARISRGSNLTVMCCVSIALTSVQILSAMSQMPIEWIEPVTTLKRLFDVVSMRLDLVQPQCIFNVNTAAGHYTGSLFLFPIMAFVVRVMFKLIEVSKYVALESHCVWNALGRVFLLGYLPLALLAFTPFQCITNPGGAPATLAGYRSVICWESDAHRAMLVGSICAVLAFPVSLLVVVIMAVLQFPARMAQPGGVVWLKQYTFLFQRFRSEYYYYALVHLLRSFFMALLPNMLPNEPDALVMLMVGILSLNLALQCTLWSWRTYTANVIDVVCSCGLMQIMTAGGIIMKFDESSDLVLQIIMTAILVFLTASTGLATAYFAFRIFVPAKPYAMFLSHHKAGAAVLCRYIKLVIKEKVYGRVFLDCDELDNLLIVFSIAAEDCKNFVMVLTHDMLTRFWCAGEIASAYRHKTHMIGLACDDYESPTDEFIDGIETMWSARQRCELSSMGVSIEDVQTAYRGLQKMEMLAFKRDSTLRQQDQVMNQLLSKCVGLKYKMVTRLTGVVGLFDRDASLKPMKIDDRNQSDLFICGDFADMEAMFTVRVLHRLLQFEMLRVVEIVQSGEELLEKRGETIYARQYLLVVCTKGILDCESMPWFLAAAYGMSATAVVTDKAFSFPDAAYYEELLQGKKNIANSDFSKTLGVRRVSELYMALFKSLSMTFTSHASEMIQATEIKVISQRLGEEQLDEPIQRSAILQEMQQRRDVTPRKLKDSGTFRSGDRRSWADSAAETEDLVENWNEAAMDSRRSSESSSAWRKSFDGVEGMMHECGVDLDVLRFQA